MMIMTHIQIISGLVFVWPTIKLMETHQPWNVRRPHGTQCNTLTIIVHHYSNPHRGTSRGPGLQINARQECFVFKVSWCWASWIEGWIYKNRKARHYCRKLETGGLFPTPRDENILLAAFKYLNLNTAVLSLILSWTAIQSNLENEVNLAMFL